MFFFLRYLEGKTLFQLYNVLESYRNEYRKTSADREYFDENVSLKAHRALSKCDFLIHLKSKKSSNLYVKDIEHGARGPHILERKVRQSNLAP